MAKYCKDQQTTAKKILIISCELNVKIFKDKVYILEEMLIAKDKVQTQ